MHLYPTIEAMNLQIHFALFLTFSLVACASYSAPDEKAFVSCLLKRSTDPKIASIIYTPKNTQFLTVLDFLIQNARFIDPRTPKPKTLLRPTKESHIQTAIYCGRRHNLEMRIRSGGHDFEGSSYISGVPYFVLDMFNFQSLTVDSKTKTAWLGAGLSLGQVYYGINAVNGSLAFAGGFWPTVGVGGHISGGGYGPLVRQFGLAADNVIDARVIDVNGRILDRKSMGEDLFWAIRGGDAASFAVILSYRVNLHEVPKTVVGSRIRRTVEQNAIQLVDKWQQIARKLPLELTLGVELRGFVSPETGNRTGYAEFFTVYRGGVDEFVSIMRSFFPELGLTKNDCQEMSWIQVYPFLIELSLSSINVKDILTNRNSPLGKAAFKWKVDLPENPIPPQGIPKIFEELNKVPPLSARVGFTVFGGGIMDQIPESQIPFPHRGKLMLMRQVIFWNSNDTSAVVKSRVSWVRGLHEIMTPYVSNNPRAQYADYRDFDLGVNNVLGRTSVGLARKWGLPYFKDNFDRLVRVKTLVDPTNFLKYEQSFPPMDKKY